MQGNTSINSIDIRSQFSAALQKLLDAVLSKSDGRPLDFVDEGEYTIITGRSPELSEGEACFTGSERRFIICLKSLEPMTPEKELSIAHELGHLWLSFHGFPRGEICSDAEKQRAFEVCFGPLRDIMEHAIFYPWLKADFKIDLYKRENRRLVNFIRSDLPKRKIESKGDQISLILNYVKFKVQSDDKYWQDRLQKAYSKTNFVNLRETAETVLPIIQELERKPLDPQDFIKKYREILRGMNIEQGIWPDFVIKN